MCVCVCVCMCVLCGVCIFMDAGMAHYHYSRNKSVFIDSVVEYVCSALHFWFLVQY